MMRAFQSVTVTNVRPGLRRTGVIGAGLLLLTALHGSPPRNLVAQLPWAGSGDMLCYCDFAGGITRPAAGIPALLELKAAHPALFQNSSRRMIHTSDDHAYAILRESADHSERLVLVFNFRAGPANISVHSGAIRAKQYVDVATSSAVQTGPEGLSLTPPPHGYNIFAVS